MSGGQTPLSMLVRKGQADVEYCCTEFKADLTIQGNDGHTVLMLATIGGHDDLALALLHDYHCPVTGRESFRDGCPL